MVEPSLSEKVTFLGNPRAYFGLPVQPVALETHMSWVFLAGDKAFKLKKPVRFFYLDFSTLERREDACRAELELNRRLAPTVYLDVMPLCVGTTGLSLGGIGEIVDWVVVMRRLDRTRMLDRAINAGDVNGLAIDSVVQSLARFYQRADRAAVSSASHIREWVRKLAENRKVLLLQDLRLPAGPVWRIDRVQRRFLAEHRQLIANRVRAKRIVDGHGDLRPEHIWLGNPPQIIDCLEFNRQLRVVDPFDEIAFLSIECERLNAAWVGERIRRRLAHALNDRIPDELFHFYRCYRATLRARLTIAHMLEPDPRTPEKWPRAARDYLRIAEREAIWLEQRLRRRADRPRRAHRGDGGWSRQTARPNEE